MQTKAVAESRRDCGRGGIETVPALVYASKVWDDFFVLNLPIISREHNNLQFLLSVLLISLWFSNESFFIYFLLTRSEVIRYSPLRPRTCYGAIACPTSRYRMREILRILKVLVCSILHVIMAPSIQEQIQRSPTSDRGMRTTTKKPQTRKTRLHVTFPAIDQLLN